MFHFWFNTFFIAERGFCEQNSERIQSNGQHSDCSVARSKRRSQKIEEQSDMLVLSLRKKELDMANKDKAHKLFSPNFEVSLHTCVSRVQSHSRTSNRG